MQITVSIKTGSASHKWLTEGVQRFGQKNYRHKHQGKYYTVVDAKPAERGAFDLILEPVF